MNTPPFRTLSRNEAKIVLDLEWRDLKTVTLAELHASLGASKEYARYIAHQLVKKGWFERLRPGLYQLIPADRGSEAVADFNPLLAGTALINPYFFSFGTACTHHGLTDQMFAEICLVSRRRRRPVKIRGIRYLFIHAAEQRFFGFAEASVLGVPVQMAVPERALIDALDRPHYAGGLGEVSLMVERSISRLIPERLLDMLERWRESALVQRLGYFIDLHDAVIQEGLREELVRLIRPGNKVLLGPRKRWGTTGRLAHPWNIIENVPCEALLEQGVERRQHIKIKLNRESLRDR
jgi:predicted transcriptional regulator of viral defense system